MKNWFRLTIVFLFVPGAFYAGQFFTGEKRMLPSKWTEPRAVKDGNATTIVPSLPAEFEEKKFGSNIQVEKATSHRIISSEKPKRATRYAIKIKGGKTIEAKENEPFEVNGRQFMILGVNDDNGLSVKNLESGRIKELSPKRWQRQPDQ